MKMSARELVLLLVTVGVILFGSSALLVRPRWREWKTLTAEKASLDQQMVLDQTLIGQRDRWQQEMDALSRMLARQPAGEPADIYFLSVMDRLATESGVTILRRQVGEEKPQGDVFELPIECKDWEGDLSSTVHFLFALQSEGAMFDIRQLLIRPKGDRLRGRFLLYGAYVRDEAGTNSVAASPVSVDAK